MCLLGVHPPSGTVWKKHVVLVNAIAEGLKCLSVLPETALYDFAFSDMRLQAIFGCQKWRTSSALCFWLLSDLILPYDTQILGSSCYSQGRSWLGSWALTGVSPCLQIVPLQLT